MNVIDLREPAAALSPRDRRMVAALAAELNVAEPRMVSAYRQALSVAAEAEEALAEAPS